ncbi:SAM-dependent methyltransferase [Nocardia aurantiaca]|uniref:SAM-dependent methyltransferase n=1 Tax=Nocardia aurantiaca TaxID=2675850 RepID=A0A6I3KUE2_9NOCA|nr:SAM-dependent methyltransferase [Nocardia aurantiaca]MTE11694.1 SAM-dependent methyltransferase [Nocardia aurantiaca]
MTEQPRVDQSKPSIARVYDYLLGGKDNYAADREVGDFFIKDLPGSVDIAYANRNCLVRAIGEMSRAGIEQFVDIGSGLPTAANVHQVAQRHRSEPHVVYVDNDPIVLAHGRAILETDANTTVIQADLRDSEAIRHHPEVERLIDFTQPVAVVFSAILHHLNNDEKPEQVVRYWADQISSCSMVYISHFRSGFNEETRVAEQKLQSTFGRGRWRTDEEILALFGDLEILEPGLVPCSLWRPEPTAEGVARIGGDHHDLSVWQQLISAALSRKP